VQRFRSYNPLIQDASLKEYKSKVKELIRKRYESAEEELAIMRKHVAGIDNKNEFDDYNTYVENCKLQAKEELGLV